MLPNASVLILVAERASPKLLIVLPMEGSGREATFLGRRHREVCSMFKVLTYSWMPKRV